jgi:ribosomal protein S12 methylthiotransferase accessory factor
MMDLAVPTIQAENAAAQRLAAQLQAEAPGCALCIGSVSYLAHCATPTGPALYIWRLANLLCVWRVDCAERTALAAMLHHAAWRHANNSAWPVLAPQPPALTQRFALDSPLQAALVQALVQRVWHQAAPDGALWCVDLESGSVHAPAPSAASELRAVRADHSPMRHRPLEQVGPAALALATHPVSGLLAPPANDLDAPLPSSSADLRLAGMPAIITLGRAATGRQAAQVACLEALERFAGLTSAHGAQAWQARLADVSAPKVDPRDCGLHLDASYGEPDFPYQPFQPERELDWVHGQELASGRAVALPACMAYYGGTARFPRVRLTYETSNGCALGTSQEEASLHGLLELVERDAFLMAWYRRTPLQDITRQLRQHEQVRWLLDKLALLSGGTVHILDSSVGFGIPSVVCCLLGPGLPAQVLSAGASLNYVAAASAALAELSGHWLFLRQRFSDEAVRRHAQALFDGSAAVESMEDHGYVNALPASRARIAFLLQGPASADDYRLQQAPSGLDSVGASLAWLVQRLGQSGLMPISVPQPVPMLQQAGLHCVKVVCPGLLPMTFGHRHRRLSLSRLGDQAAQQQAAALPPHPFM